MPCPHYDPGWCGSRLIRVEADRNRLNPVRTGAPTHIHTAQRHVQNTWLYKNGDASFCVSALLRFVSSTDATRIWQTQKSVFTAAMFARIPASRAHGLLARKWFYSVPHRPVCIVHRHLPKFPRDILSLARSSQPWSCVHGHAYVCACRRRLSCDRYHAHRWIRVELTSTHMRMWVRWIRIESGLMRTRNKCGRDRTQFDPGSGPSADTALEKYNLLHYHKIS